MKRKFTHAHGFLSMALALGIAYPLVASAFPSGVLGPLPAASGVVGGNSISAKVYFSDPVSTDMVVTLSDNSANVSMPATVTVPQGETEVTFTIQTTTTTSAQNVTLTATCDGQTSNGTLSINTAPPNGG
jgi:hypothetical protein